MSLRYGVCFRFLLAFLLTRLPVLLRRDDLSIAMVLEEGAPGSMDAYRIVQQLRKQPETQDIMNMFDGLSFGPKEKFPGLQVSDSLSFGALKITPTAPLMIDINEDSTLAQSRKAVQWKPPVFHCRLDERHLGALKSDILALVEIRKLIAADAIAARAGDAG